MDRRYIINVILLANFLANIEKMELKRYTITKEEYEDDTLILDKVLNYFC